VEIAGLASAERQRHAANGWNQRLNGGAKKKRPRLLGAGWFELKGGYFFFFAAAFFLAGAFFLAAAFFLVAFFIE
jgi:hypothetical protein